MTRLLACRHLLLALCAGLFLTACPTPVAAQPATGTIRGKLTDGGVAQPGVDVFVYDVGGVPVGKATTTADGKFEFGGLTPGVYRLFSEKPAANREVREAVKVTAGATVKADLGLLLK